MGSGKFEVFVGRYLGRGRLLMVEAPVLCKITLWVAPQCRDELTNFEISIKPAKINPKLSHTTTYNHTVFSIIVSEGGGG